MYNNPFTATILIWYNKNKRALPWRGLKDPYRIWLSEVILQQTRVAQGLPYYNTFVEKYPSVEDLASAPEDEVLRIWQGLGYYSRARNLHKCAKFIVNELHGRFPTTMEDLLELPGIGKYSAAAIASIAFGKPTPVVDGNVYRLLSRFFGIGIDISSSKAHKYFYDLSLTLMDKKVPASYNQAVMEFGALYCTPKNPNCESCVLRNGCIAFSKSLQTTLPVKKKKIKVTNRYFQYYVLIHNKQILMRQRSEKDIWHGLYEFILFETSKDVDLALVDHPIFAELENNKLIIEKEDKNIRHVLSHQILNVSFAIIKVEGNPEAVKKMVKDGYYWYSFNEVEDLPKPVLISNYLDTYLNSINLQEEKK